MSSFTGYEFTDKNRYNLIELGRPKTRQEREFTSSHAHSPLDFGDAYRRLPILLRLINEDRKALGFKDKIGLPEKGAYK
jgi:hypothetical protein